MVIQLISLIIALIGLFLAFIEVRNPDKADRIENIILDIGNIKWPPRQGDFQYRRSWRIFISMEVITMIAVWFVVLSDFGLKYISIFNSLKGKPAILLYIPIFLILLFLLIFAPIIIPALILKGTSKLIHWANKISKGHALGAFGLAIAVIGLLIALFQTSIILLF